MTDQISPYLAEVQQRIQRYDTKVIKLPPNTRRMTPEEADAFVRGSNALIEPLVVAKAKPRWLSPFAWRLIAACAIAFAAGFVLMERM